MSGQFTVPFGEVFLFLKRWAKNPLQLGSIAPSSKALSSFLARNAVMNEGDYIIEIGGGTGAISRAILNSGVPETRLIVVELDAELAKFLRKSLPFGVKVIQGNAEHLDKILPPACLGHISTIISALPMRNIPDSVQKNIVEACFKAMGGKGSILQYTYALTSPLKHQDLHLEYKKLGLILQNIPPATVWKYWR
ncbi:Methyltransferase domain-containing protein [Candidatus Bealeia paramacronuclearis]|uniref:Methyltransferase domain-containing protein n=1 Tax=Candidatus Bealeia paramacronuclearis TaxID=1921001 RepID=A0ABZ2C5N4_9PROT|nr:Methyltransferase domain-containing protein [Candidatus Bealeia paramacronuclearis]